MRFSLKLDKLVFSLILIGIGVGLLLDNFNLIEFDFVHFLKTYWPALIIYVGFKIIVDGIKLSHLFSGGFIFSLLFGLAIGLVGWNLLARNLDYPSVSFGLIWNIFWPSLLIIIGLKILFRKKPTTLRIEMDKHKSTSYWDEKEEQWVQSEEDTYKYEKSKKKKIYKSTLIGDINLGREIFELEDIHLWHGIGDVDIDLSRAILLDGETNITISGWIGDVDIFVPRELPVLIYTNLKIGEYRIFDEREDGIRKISTYKSPDYDFALKKVCIHIDLKIGDVRVKEV